AWAKAAPTPEKATVNVAAAPQVLQPHTAAELRAQLRAVPEVALYEAIADEPPKDGGVPGPRPQATAAGQQIAKQAVEVAQLIGPDPDGFVKHIVAKRPDLAGLPWRMGKDCQLAKVQAQTLQQLSLDIRGSLDTSLRFSASTPTDSRRANDHDPEEA